MDNLNHIKQVIFVLICLGLEFSIPFGVNAQDILVRGQVNDVRGKVPIAEVTVRELGTTTFATTDQEGRFEIKVSKQNKRLLFTHVGYHSKEILYTGQNRSISLVMTPSNLVLDEVRVDVRRRANTEVAVLEERRRSGIIQDAISAQQIERTASITATQALQRVTGVTVTDDKYVAVRGLGDRSVIGQLNGARLASSNPDRSTIPLDLVPAALLDNITVYKSFTPDKPADAAAGIVELKTKSIPDTMILEFAVQTGYNSNIGIGGRYNSFDNSEIGIWGNGIKDKYLSDDFLNLSKQYPGGLSEIQRFIANSNMNVGDRAETERINGIMQSFDQTLTTGYRKAPVNQQYSINFGNSYHLFEGRHRLGLILGGNYYRRYADIYDGTINQYSIYQGVVTGNDDIYSQRNIPNYITTNNINLGRYQTYRENTGTETLNYGMLAGVAYRFSPLHEISGQFLGSWGGETGATNMLGRYEYSGLAAEISSEINSLKQTFRNLYAYNLQGEHRLSGKEYSPKLNYAASSSRSSHHDPDYRFSSLATLHATTQDVSDRYVLVSGYVNGYGPYGIIQAEPNGRRWRELEETNYNYKADLEVPFSWLGQRQLFKTGFNYLHRERAFTENHLFLPGSNYTGYSNGPLYRVDGDLDRLVSNEIVGVQTGAVIGEGSLLQNGFLYNIQKSPNNYTGYYETNALYAMLDLRPTERWRLTGGVRLERTDIGSTVDTVNVFLDPSLTTTRADGTKLPLLLTEPNSRYRQGYKPFYSVNLTYSPQPDMNLRMGYNTTLARPELREITNVFEFDPFQLGLVVGNPDLKNQTTQNLDFRWEWFPAIGEVIAVSAFGKRIHNQLVKVFSLQTGGLSATYPEFPAISFENEQNVGKVWGLEFEVVKNLGSLWSSFRNFSLGTNLMLAQSDIRKSDSRYYASTTLDRNSPKNSPLFEQAPYSVNAWLNFMHKRWGTDLTATFNIVGERLVQINLLGEPDLYTRPVPVLDFVFSQRIDRRFTLKGFAKNILDPDIKTVYSNPETGGKWYGREYIQRSYRRGAEIMLGLSYNLF